MEYGKVAIIIAAVFAATVCIAVPFVMHDGGSDPDAAEIRVDTDFGIDHVTGAGTHTIGDTVTLTPVLNPGYFFDGWYSEDGQLLSESLTRTVQAEDMHLQARTSRSVTVTVSSTDDYGLLSVTGTGTYMHGDPVGIRAGIREGYVFTGWYSDGIRISGDADGGFSSSVFKSSRVDLEARVHTDVTVSFSLSKGTGVDTVSGQGTYLLGTVVKVSATVLPGYSFDGWYIGPDRISGSASAYIHAGTDTVSARARLNPPVTVSLMMEDGVNSVVGETTIPRGMTFDLKAVLQPGYSFDGWYDRNYNMVCGHAHYTFTAQGSILLRAVGTPEYTLHSLGMPGVTTFGKEVCKTSEEPWVRAIEGDLRSFEGWYTLDGTKLSGSKDYHPSPGDGAYVARTNNDIYAGSNILSLTGYPEWYTEDCYVVVMDHLTGKYVESHAGTGTKQTGVTPGVYDVIYYNGLYDRSAVQETQTVTLGDTVRLHYYWNFRNKDYGAEWNVPISLYDKYSEFSLIPRSGYVKDLGGAAGHKDPWLIKMAEYLLDQSAGMSERDRADFVLKFVQLTTEYQYDEDFNGQGDYWKHPMETMIQMRGDCEDTALLYASLMKAMGVDAILLGYDSSVSMEYIGIGHAAAAVKLPEGTPGTYYNYNGGRYYYCETTSDTMKVGEPWDQYGTARLIPLK